MLRVLTLSTLFPNALQPTLGVFVERQTLGLAERGDVALEAVSPAGRPSWPLSLHPHYAPRRGLPIEEVWKGLPVHRPRFSPFPARLQPEAIARAVRPIAEAFRPDVIDAEFFWPDGPAAMRLARALDIPFSVKARGADIHYWATRPGIGAQILKAAGAADGLLAVSAALKADMVTLGMPGEKIRVHHTGVDVDLFHPGAAASLDTDGPLVVTAGALIPRKRPELVLAVARLVPEATFLFVGDGPERSRLERTAGPNVHFAGAQPHEALPGYLAAADVMLLPSRSEGLANVWVEALACGTPLVVTDAGGVREVVTIPEAGRIVAPEPEALAEAVRSLIGAPPDRAAVRSAALSFSWQRNAAELFVHLTRVSAQRH
ncbi:MAG: teichuronic acid biosynthesis glycosyltransferase TuaC [Sphingomonadales bacterium]|jgi:glycosyltransferase involved in cell wall biosynthesis|nr:teichuronic acid biosynthesis glycosyltransferase TuaC [Sphingomonadales bacterium]